MLLTRSQCGPGLEFGNPLDCLERPEDAEDTEGLDRAQVLPRGAPPKRTFFLELRGIYVINTMVLGGG